MKVLLATAAVAASLAFAAPASAQPGNWQAVNARQAQIENRIDVGVRNGSLSRREAANLRAEFRALERLEARYRVNGLSLAERRDLDRRFDALSQRVRYERHDRQQQVNWTTINQRQANLDRRIDVGVRRGQLTRYEAARLRTEFRQIAYLENQYRRSGGGLSVSERRDLDRRFDALSARIQMDRADYQQRR